MTDKTPERLCYVNCGLPLLECRCYRENFQHWPQPVSPAPEGYVPASAHAAVVAERDQLKAKLESVTKRLALKARDLSQDARNHKAERVLVEIVQELEKHRA